MIVTWGSGRPVPTLFAGLVAWNRFGIGISSSGGFVSQWSDQSGNGNHLLQATGAAQPALQGDGTILFDGIAHFMKAAGYTLNQPETVYFLGRQVTWTGADRIFDGNALSGGTLFQNVATPEVDINAGSTAAPNTNLAVNTYGAVAVVFNGAASLIQVNNTAPTTGPAGANNLGGFCLGARGDGVGAFANIQVKEIIIYNTAHDQATRDTIIGYLNRL